MDRRNFVKKSLQLSSYLLWGNIPYNVIAQDNKQQTLTILHTNDVHSRLDPFPMDGSKYQGMGGVSARKKILDEVRSKKNNVLLLDAGDMFQGTPYFNFYKGEPEIKVMNAMQYDAGTIGNHDFDAGTDVLVQRIVEADFPLVNCNYDVNNTPLQDRLLPYHIIQKEKIRVGILGVGIELKGLVPSQLYGAVEYKDPIVCANETAYFLHKKKKCDYIICLSHLGFEYKDNKVSDKILAKESEHIHLIIGGHTHTFMSKPHTLKNRNNQEVIINQVGWAGLHVGEIDIFFNNKNRQDYVYKFVTKKVIESC